MPAPVEEDLAKGILEAIDMDSYRAEKKGDHGERATRCGRRDRTLDMRGAASVPPLTRSPSIISPKRAFQGWIAGWKPADALCHRLMANYRNHGRAIEADLTVVTKRLPHEAT